jgi:hypothetical protein
VRRRRRRRRRLESCLLLLLHNPQLQKAPQNSLQNVTIPLLPSCSCKLGILEFVFNCTQGQPQLYTEISCRI